MSAETSGPDRWWRRGAFRASSSAFLFVLLVLLVAGAPSLAGAAAGQAPKGPAASLGATKLVAVRSDKEGSRQVIRLESDGRAAATVEKRSGPLRLVVSLPGVRNAVPGASLKLSGPFVRKVGFRKASQDGRGGVQVVLYLASPASHEVRRDATGLSIVLSEEGPAADLGTGAQPVRVSSPSVTGPRISLADAIRQTLEASPDLRLAREAYRARRGLLVEAAGPFDPTIRFVPTYQRALSTVLAPGPGIAGRAGLFVSSPAQGASFAAVGFGFPFLSADTSTIPVADEVDTFTMDLQLPFRFRNGLVASPFLTSTSTRDRTTSGPAFYQVEAGLQVDVPLGRGAGSASAGAAEKAARLEAEAALELVGHEASRRVLGTVLTYWNLVAAQERLALLERSADQQRQIGQHTQALVAADELARSEMDRVRARGADAETAAASARQALVAARVDLARSMGALVADLNDAPLAADPLPEAPGETEMERLSAPALTALAGSFRADLRAARRRLEAADVLWTAARVDLRPRIDLSIRAGYMGLHEERDRGVLSLDGIGKSISGRWSGPNAIFSLRIELPFGNNALRGAWVLAGSVRERAGLSALDLERTVGIRMVELSSSVRQAAAEAASRRVSAEESDRMVGAAFEQLRAGELSLIDAILTERIQTQAGLDLVASRQLVASLVAQLRFEAGSLLKVVTRGEDVETGEASPVGLSFGGAR